MANEQGELSTEHQTPQREIVVVREPRDESGKPNVGNGERVASAVVGSALLLHGVKHPSLRNLILGIAGGMMVKRGVFGHCDIYQHYGINTNQPGE